LAAMIARLVRDLFAVAAVGEPTDPPREQTQS
jgi:hypothetical protein